MPVPTSSPIPGRVGKTKNEVVSTVEMSGRYTRHHRKTYKPPLTVFSFMGITNYMRYLLKQSECDGVDSSQAGSNSEKTGSFG